MQKNFLSLPILLNKAFTDRKNDRFALSNKHLNLQKRTITIPRYLILSTHIMMERQQQFGYLNLFDYQITAV